MPKVKASRSAPNRVNAWPRNAPLLAGTGRGCARGRLNTPGSRRTVVGDDPLSCRDGGPETVEQPSLADPAYLLSGMRHYEDFGVGATRDCPSPW